MSIQFCLDSNSHGLLREQLKKCTAWAAVDSLSCPCSKSTGKNVSSFSKINSVFKHTAIKHRIYFISLLNESTSWLVHSHPAGERWDNVSGQCRDCLRSRMLDLF